MEMSDLDVAYRAVRAGADVVRTHSTGPVQRIEKGGADFATDVDIASERAILDVIRTWRPGDAVCGEESGRTEVSGAERMWLVDPLCGTLNFAAGIPMYGINVALIRGDDVVCAVVADLSGELSEYSSLRSSTSSASASTTFRSWCTRPSSEYLIADGTRMWSQQEGSTEVTDPKPSASSRLVEVNMETEDPDEQGFSSSRFLRSRAFEMLSPRFIGTSLPLAWVASGRYAGFVIPGRRDTSVHFTTGIGLCRAAGCVLSGLHGEPLHLVNDGIVVAADKTTHELLLAGIAEQFRAN